MKIGLHRIWRSFRVSVKLVFSYVKVHYRLFVISLLLGIVSIYAIPQLFLRLATKRPHTTGLPANATLSSLPLKLQREISFGLTKLTEDGAATQAAATSWQASESGRVVTFNLDHNLFWQDGTKFESSQIQYNLKGVQVKRNSLYQIEFTFKEPFAPLPALISQPIFKNGLIGLGGSRIEGYRLNGRFLGSLSLIDTLSGERKIYKFYPNEEATVLALKLGSIDEAYGLTKVYDLDKDQHYKIDSEIKNNSIATLFFNVRKDPFSEKGFRQALTYSLPDNYSSGETALSSLPRGSWASVENAKRYNQNKEIARNGITKFASSSAKLKLSLYSSKELGELANVIASVWNEIGLPTQVIISDAPPRNFDAYLKYLEIGPDPDQYSLWHSTQIGNLSGYNSPKVDRLLEDGRRTLDQSERKKIYAAFAKAITEDVPAVFLYYPRTYNVKRK